MVLIEKMNFYEKNEISTYLFMVNRFFSMVLRMMPDLRELSNFII